MCIRDRGIDDVLPAEPRDSKEEVEDCVAEITASLGWIYLGEEGREINAILGETLAQDDEEQADAWRDHLINQLRFPFKAKVSEWQKPGAPFKAGDTVVVNGLGGADYSYGIIANLKSGYSIPLADLKVKPTKGKNHDLVHLYAVWFANR